MRPTVIHAGDACEGNRMRIGYYQFAPLLREAEANRTCMARALESIEADLVVLPELANSGYNFAAMEDLVSTAEDVESGPTIALWSELAAKRKLTVVGGFAERAEGRFYNSAAIVRPTGEIDVYRKIHLFGRESDFFAAGEDPPRTFDIPGARIGVMICFDWAFPETARCLALAGAEIICHPGNILTAFPPMAMRVRGVENRVFTVTANRIGTEEGSAGTICFRGLSQVTAPSGEVLVSSDEESEEVCCAEIDPAAAHDKRLAGYTDLFASRRPELYGRIGREEVE